MSKTTLLLILAIVAACAIGVGSGLTYKLGHKPAMPPKLHEYCTAVMVALEQDAQAFERGNAAEVDAAVRRFGEQVTFHSEHEIYLCAAKPVALERRGLCAIKPDAGCLAELARAAAAAVREGL